MGAARGSGARADGRPSRPVGAQASGSQNLLFTWAAEYGSSQQSCSQRSLHGAVGQATEMTKCGSPMEVVAQPGTQLSLQGAEE